MNVLNAPLLERLSWIAGLLGAAIAVYGYLTASHVLELDEPTSVGPALTGINAPSLRSSEAQRRLPVDEGSLEGRNSSKSSSPLKSSSSAFSSLKGRPPPSADELGRLKRELAQVKEALEESERQRAALEFRLELAKQAAIKSALAPSDRMQIQVVPVPLLPASQPEREGKPFDSYLAIASLVLACTSLLGFMYNSYLNRQKELRDQVKERREQQTFDLDQRRKALELAKLEGEPKVSAQPQASDDKDLSP